MLPEFLTGPYSGPVWGVVGIVATKGFDWLTNKRKSNVDQLNVVQQAQNNLVEGLFQQVKLLQEEVQRLRTHTEAVEKKYAEATRHIEELRAELAELRQHSEHH